MDFLKGCLARIHDCKALQRAVLLHHGGRDFRS